jgi:hypothetical protein
MIDRVSDIFGIKPERLIADTAYGKGEMLDWLDRQRGIAPHIPVIDKSGRKDGHRVIDGVERRPDHRGTINGKPQAHQPPANGAIQLDMDETAKPRDDGQC